MRGVTSAHKKTGLHINFVEQNIKSSQSTQYRNISCGKTALDTNKKRREIPALSETEARSD